MTAFYLNWWAKTFCGTRILSTHSLSSATGTAKIGLQQTHHHGLWLLLNVDIICKCNSKYIESVSQQAIMMIVKWNNPTFLWYSNQLTNLSKQSTRCLSMLTYTVFSIKEKNIQSNCTFKVSEWLFSQSELCLYY